MKKFFKLILLVQALTLLVNSPLTGFYTQEARAVQSCGVTPHGSYNNPIDTVMNAGTVADEPNGFTTTAHVRFEDSDPDALNNAKDNYARVDGNANQLVYLNDGVPSDSSEIVEEGDGYFVVRYVFTPTEGLPPEYTITINNDDSSGAACAGSGTQLSVSTTAGSNPGADSSDSSPAAPAVYDPCEQAENKSYCQTRLKCQGNNDESRCVSMKVCEEVGEGHVYTSAFIGGSALTPPANSDPQLKGGGSLEPVEPFGGCYNLESFMGTLVNYLLTFATIIAGLVFSFGAYKYLTSRGDPSATADARDMIIQSVIGFVVLALAFVLITFLGGAFGSGVTEDINLEPPFDSRTQ